MPYKDPEKAKAYQREYMRKRMRDKYQNDPQYREEHKAYQRTPERLAASREYYAKPEIRERKKTKRNTPASKQAQRRLTYGISEIDQQALFDSQGGCCAVCRKVLDQFASNCHLDHDHVTGEVRGFLCQRCNKAVAFYEKHADVALAYLGLHAVQRP